MAVLLHELFDERNRVGVACWLAIVASVSIGTNGANGQEDRFVRNEVLDVGASDEVIGGDALEDGPDGTRNDVGDHVVSVD